MTWKIPQSTLTAWSRLNADVPKQEATDCVVNSLHLLGVLKNRAFSEAIAKKINTKKKGLYDYQILHLIYEYLNRKEGVYSEETKTTAGLYRGDLQHMKNGEYTFAIFRNVVISHAVVLYKHEDTIYVYDPQQEHSCSETELQEWIKDGKYYGIDFLYYEKTARLRSKTNTKTKSNTNTRKKIRPEFDKNAVVFAVGTKGEQGKKRTKRARKPKKKVSSVDSLVKKFEKLDLSTNDSLVKQFEKLKI